MPASLQEKRIAILATDGFEQSELLEPRKALEQAGATCEVISLKAGSIKGWNHDQWGESVKVDRLVTSARAEDYDALLLPGGVMNPDKLRMNEEAMEFVAAFVDDGKPIGAICHGPWSLVEVDAVEDRELTSWPSLRTDIENAGGRWVDQAVVVDEGIVTSRKPDDLPLFNAKLIEEIGEGPHHRTQPSLSEEYQTLQVTEEYRQES